MENKNMTALVCLFVRAYHNKNYEEKIYCDDIAKKVIKDEEYNSIASNMSSGIKFFNPNFEGSSDEALKWIVENQLSPSVLARSAFCERAFDSEIKLNCKQYISLASGYDTFILNEKYKNIKSYEIDKKEMIDDKIKRLKNAYINICC